MKNLSHSLYKIFSLIGLACVVSSVFFPFGALLRNYLSWGGLSLMGIGVVVYLPNLSAAELKKFLLESFTMVAAITIVTQLFSFSVAAYLLIAYVLTRQVWLTVRKNWSKGEKPSA